MIPATIAAAILIYAALSIVSAPLIAWLCKTSPQEINPPMHIDDAKIDRLTTLRLRSISRREKFEAEEEADKREACRLIGVDYDSGDYGSELACEIVSHTQHVVPTLRRIEDWRGMVGVESEPYGKPTASPTNIRGTQ